MLSGLETWEAVAGIAAVGGPAIVAIWKKVINPMRKRRAEREAKLDSVFKSVQPNGHGTVIQIVERIEAEVNGLRRDTELNKQLILASMDVLDNAIWLSNAMGRCVYASERLAGYMGVERQQVLGNGWRGEIADEFKADTTHEWDLSVAEQRSFERVYAFRRNPGQLYQGKTIVLHDPQTGDVYGYVGTLTPITEG